MPQFVYVDEAGDTGFRFAQGSSRFFVVVLLFVSDPLPLHTAVDDLRTEFGYRSDSEFKFYGSRPTVRESFLRMLTRFDVQARAIVIDKQFLTGSPAADRKRFYDFVVEMVLQHAGSRLQDATIILDRRDRSRSNQQSTATYLRRSLNSDGGSPRRVADIRYHDSHRDNLLQAVDMLAGAVNWQFSRNDSSYVRIAQSRIEDIWVWQPDQS